MANVFDKLREANFSNESRFKLEMYELMDIVVQISRLKEYNKKEAIDKYMDLYSRKFSSRNEHQDMNSSCWKLFTEVSKAVFFSNYVVDQDESQIFYLVIKMSCLKRLKYSNIDIVKGIETTAYEYYVDNNQTFRKLVFDVIDEIKSSLLVA